MSFNVHRGSHNKLRWGTPPARKGCMLVARDEIKQEHDVNEYLAVCQRKLATSSNWVVYLVVIAFVPLQDQMFRSYLCNLNKSISLIVQAYF